MKPLQVFVGCLTLFVLASGQINTVAADDPIELDPIIVEAEQKRIEAIARAMPSAVSIFVPGGGGGGSGVLISPEGYALTNFHVTSPAGSHMRCGLSDGNIYDAVIVGIDPVGDLALIRLLGRDNFPYAKLADSRLAQAGDWCMVIGNPFLLASNLQPTVTWGILSGVGRYQYPSGTLLEYTDCLQTDASINPGNSGGPLYNADGDLLGIVGRASFEKRKRVNVGVGYAISINQAKNFLGHLRSGRIVDHATLGATYATDPDGGVRITNILESSDAYRRGLRYNDEVLEIDGRVVQTANDLQNILGTLPSGWRVKLSFRHDGETKDTLVRLSGVHRPDELLKKMAGVMPPPPPRPQPKPKEKAPQGDEGDAPEEGQKDDREESPETRKAPAKPDRDVPPAVAKMLVERKGYANYFFNLQQQQAFIDSLRSQFPAGGDAKRATWEIEGQTAAPESLLVRVRLDDEKRALVVGDLAFEAGTRADMYDEVDAGSPAGLLPALDAWRRMIETGPEQFGESYYVGEMPLAGERPLRHCMLGIDGEMEVRWLSHPETRLIEVIEVFADRDGDPAELWFYRDSDDPNSPPDRVELRYGIDTVLAFNVTSWKRAAESEGDAEKADELKAETSP